MPGTVTERRTWLILKLCGFETVVLMNVKNTFFQNVIRCSLIEIYKYFGENAHFMYKTLDPECGGGRVFRNVNIVLKNFSLSPPPPPHYTTNEKDVFVQLSTMSHGCMGELWPVLP
jgi:hypothetical protein